MNNNVALPIPGTYPSEAPAVGPSAAQPVQQIMALDRQRLRDYQANLDFYAGRQWPVQRRNARQRRLTFNYARTLVDKTASFLLSGVSFSVDAESPEDTAAAARREAVLRQI